MPGGVIPGSATPYWGEKKLRPFVETIRAHAEHEGDERLAQLAERFLR
jgi:hypothetical protein